MKCPRCGNEVSQDEAFCGQCGTPIMPPARLTEMVNTSAPRSGQLNSYQANMPSYNSGMLPPPTSYNPAIPVPPGSSMAPNAPIVKPSTPQQSSGFYQDATEAMSSLPGNNGYPMGYPQRNFPGVSMHGGYSGARQYGPQMQPFQTGNFAGPSYSSPTGQDYGMPARLTPPQKPQTSAILVIACVCLIIALFVFIGIGALYLLRGHSPARTVPTPLPAATSVPTIAPTVAPTAIPTPMPTPSPTVASTPTPDPGFLWCGQQCTTNGFSVEYPNTWQPGSTPDATGIQFTDPSPPDVYAAFKTPGATTNNAGTLVNTDLQTNFASKPGYTPPTASATTTIGGENWTYAIAHYQLNNQMERIEVFATVHQGKAYIIELQAPESEFDAMNSQYFEMMLGRFQFLQSAQQ